MCWRIGFYGRGGHFQTSFFAAEVVGLTLTGTKAVLGGGGFSSNEYSCFPRAGCSPGYSRIERYHHSGVSTQPGLSTKLDLSFFPFAVDIRTDYHHPIQIIRFALSYDEEKNTRVIDSQSKI